MKNRSVNPIFHGKNRGIAIGTIRFCSLFLLAGPGFRHDRIAPIGLLWSRSPAGGLRFNSPTAIVPGPDESSAGSGSRFCGPAVLVAPECALPEWPNGMRKYAANRGIGSP